MSKLSVREAQLVMLDLAKDIDVLCRKHNITYWIDAGTYLGAVRHQGFIPWDDDLDICFPIKDYDKIIKVIREELIPAKPHYILYNDHRPFEYFAEFLGDTRYVRNKLYPIHVDLIKVKSFPNTPENVQLDRDMVNLVSFFYHKFQTYDIFDKQFFRDNALSGFFLFKGEIYLKKFNKYVHEQDELKEDSNIIQNFNHMFASRDRGYQKHDVIFPLKDMDFEGYTFLVPQKSDEYLSWLYGKDYMTPPPKEQQVPMYGNFSTAIFPTFITKRLIWVLYFLKAVKNSFILVPKIKNEKQKYV